MPERRTSHAGAMDADTRDVVDRALQRMRMLAAAVLIFQSLLNRSSGQGSAVPLLTELAAAVAVFGALMALASAAGRCRGTALGRSLSAGLHVADIVVAVGVVALSRHLGAAWALLVVPVLAGALRFRLRGAFYTWLAVAALHLTWFVLAADTGGVTFGEDLGEQVTRLAVVLLVALPAGYLSEHLLIEVRGLGRVSAAAERRSALLGVVAQSNQGINDLDGHVFDAALGATTRLGFDAADLWHRDQDGWRPLAATTAAAGLPSIRTHLGNAERLPTPLIVDRATGAAHEVAELRSDGLEAVVMTSVPGLDRLTVLRAVLHEGTSLSPSQVECLRMLGQQAGVALRNGELVAELHTARADLEHQAFHDSLTGIPNRALFTRQLEECTATAARTGRMMALLFCDLDRFKGVNDSLGHAVGNELLMSAVGRLQGALREDAVLARMGGDEFTILLPDIADRRDAEQVADRVCKALTGPFTLGKHEVVISTSVGIAIGDASCLVPGELLRRGDIAMYRSKARGRGCWTAWSEDLDQATLSRLQLENDLRRAVDADEIEVVVQPVLRVDGTVVGAEALARWQHRRLGYVSPAEFIAIAEDSDLIFQLGRGLLRRAIDIGKHWLRDADSECFLSVNISPRQLAAPGFADELDQLCRAASLAPSRLLLEITERIVSSGPDAVQTLHDLAARGYRLALDDFGQGQTSLQHLRHFPLTALKIDRGFVADAVADERVRTILSSIVGLGLALDLVVIAEGIESNEQAALLTALGCTYLQGYALGLPLDASQLPAASKAHDRPNAFRDTPPLPPLPRHP